MNRLHASPSPLSLPLRALWRWLVPQPMPESRIQPSANVSCHAHTSPARPLKPLRVLQVVEAGQNPRHGARLRISGRMADVCAELDRLAAREALLH